MRVSFSPDGLAEAEEAVRWYRDNAGIEPAHLFAQELRRVIDLAVEHPGIGSPGPHGTSRLYFKRFPYTLVFRMDAGTLRVIAIAHQNRRPGYWAGRQ